MNASVSPFFDKMGEGREIVIFGMFQNKDAFGL